MGFLVLIATYSHWGKEEAISENSKAESPYILRALMCISHKTLKKQSFETESAELGVGSIWGLPGQLGLSGMEVKARRGKTFRTSPKQNKRWTGPFPLWCYVKGPIVNSKRPKDVKGGRNLQQGRGSRCAVLMQKRAC